MKFTVDSQKLTALSFTYLIFFDCQKKKKYLLMQELYYKTKFVILVKIQFQVRYVMRCVFGDPKEAPPPLEKLSGEGLVSVLWNGEGSLVEELVLSMAPHMEADQLNILKSKILCHNPSGSDNIQKELRKSLLW